MNLQALLNSTDTDDHWMDRAQCLGVDPNDMQPERATKDEVELAKSYCRGCPVFADCLNHAREQEFPYGVHAGRWFGPPPVWESVLTCEYSECTYVFRAARHRGEFPRFCSTECRLASIRAGKVLA